MKNSFWWLLSFFWLLGASAGATVPPSALPPRPNPARFVNDLAGVLTIEQRLALESKLQAYNDSTTTQLAVVLVKRVAPYDVAEYAQQLGQAWGVGQKGRNNGLVILVVTDEHRVSIQTGYGLEGGIPDLVAFEVIQEQLLPDFRRDRFYEGLEAGTTVLMHRAAGEFAPARYHPASWGQQPWWVWVLLPGLGLAFLFMLYMLVYFMRHGGSGGRGSSGRSSSFSGSSGGGSSSSGGSSFGGGSFGGGGSSGSW